MMQNHIVGFSVVAQLDEPVDDIIIHQYQYDNYFGSRCLKPVFGVCSQIRLKHICSVTE